MRRGVYEAGGGISSDVLLESKGLVVMANNVCNSNKYEYASKGRKITQEMLCASNKDSTDSCKGDCKVCGGVGGCVNLF